MTRVVFFGSTEFGLPALDALRRSGEFEVAGVVSQPDRPAGRGQELQPTSVSEYADTHGLRLFRFVTLQDDQTFDLIAALQADIFLVAAYGLIIPKRYLDLVPNRSINIHGSLLPKYRGASPISAAIMAGEQTTGITLILMTPRLDDGPIIAQHELTITPAATLPDVSTALSELAGEYILHDVAGLLDGAIQPREQAHGQASMTKKLSREDGHASWNSAEHESRRIRAYHPWPGCWTEWHGTRVKILSAEAIVGTSTVPPGTIIAHPTTPNWAIACADGILVPNLIQFAGKRPQPAVEVGSLPGFIGSSFGA